MKSGDDRHAQPRQQSQDVAAGLTTKNAELVLQADDVELLRVEKVGGAYIFFQIRIIDLQAHFGRIVVGVAMIGHGDDDGLDVCAALGYSLLQIGRECGDAAAAREGISNECQAAG